MPGLCPSPPQAHSAVETFEVCLWNVWGGEVGKGSSCPRAPHTRPASSVEPRVAMAQMRPGTGHGGRWKVERCPGSKWPPYPLPPDTPPPQIPAGGVQPEQPPRPWLVFPPLPEDGLFSQDPSQSHMFFLPSRPGGGGRPRLTPGSGLGAE